MKIIDSHLHLGDCRVFGCNISEEQLLDAMDKYGVDAAVVQPYPGATDEEDVHNRIYELTKKHKGRIYGLASVNPHLLSKADYKAKMRHYIQDFGFVGVKLHTIGHAVNPLSADAQTVYETAAELNVALNVHTGPGVPFSLPSFIIPAARKYPELKIVLAHSGAGIFSGEALIAAMECKNIFLELSWCSVEDAFGMINTLGSNRIMFGSDSLMNITTGVFVFKSLPLSDEQLEDVLSRTAAKAFGLR